MRFPSRAALALPIVIALTSPAMAAPRPAVAVTRAWSRPALPGMSTGVIYLTISNRGSEADKLVGASSPMAASVGLHRSAMSGGVATMEAVDEGLDIPAGGTAKLEPNGYHLMMMGLKGGLKAGTSFPTVLSFAHAGKVKIVVQVSATPPG